MPSELRPLIVIDSSFETSYSTCCRINEVPPRELRRKYGIPDVLNNDTMGGSVGSVACSAGFDSRNEFLHLLGRDAGFVAATHR